MEEELETIAENVFYTILGGLGVLNLLLYPLTIVITFFVWVETFYTTDIYFMESFTTKIVLFVGYPLIVLPIASCFSKSFKFNLFDMFVVLLYYSPRYHIHRSLHY